MSFNEVRKPQMKNSIVTMARARLVLLPPASIEYSCFAAPDIAI
jgi:hypothetical protein